MKLGVLVAMLLASGLCSNPLPMTAAVDASGSQSARVGDNVQLVVKVTNTGPLIPHLGLVFRTPDRWYERHKVADLSGASSPGTSRRSTAATWARMSRRRF